MSNDPFSNDEDTPAEGEGGSSVATLPAPGDNKVRVTLKGGTGYDAPWITIDGAGVHNAAINMGVKEDELQGLNGKERLKVLIDQTANVARYYSGLGPQHPSAQTNKGAPATKGSPDGAKESPDGEKRFCEHGVMDFKSGITAKGANAGKVWMAFDCSQGVCDRQWYNKK